MRIDVKLSPELQAVIFAMRSLDRTIAKIVRREVKKVAEPEWKKALAERANTRLQQRVLVNTSNISVSNQNVRATSAQKGRPLSGGFEPKYDWHAAEFGADRNRVMEYTRRSRNGGRHKVRRRIGNGLPARKKTGYVVYPAAHEMVPRLGALFFQTVYRAIATATEGKQE